ncbi:hypothetical protein SAOR_03715 [Salinisphaera orenii MK-B5]|uniref:Uncharacterized protein n=1 Tax=Salinisphaera orenii MK-B5 TaxID=856730 RepID=A0A423PUN7_9GAMM|nr:hypothetical protein [Salinisphaera orenii]ROO29271.1 hypothetical protein SAOR_03715 [Salinisphaera orenii MK-B5]
MRKAVTILAVATAGLALTACGDSEPHRPHSHGGPAVAPPASPAIHFQVNDANGNAMDLTIECGADTSLKECAEVNQKIIDKVSSAQGKAGK